MGNTPAIDPNLKKEIEEVKNELPAPGQPIRMQLETGEVVEGANWEEVAKKAMKMKVDTTLTLKQEKERRELLEREAQARQAQPAEPVKEGEFDPTKYWALLNDNKISEANLYWMGHAFGIPAEEVVDTFKGTVNKTDALWDEVEINRFKMSHPDYPATPEAAEMLGERVKQYGTEWDSATLHRAYKDLVEEGKIEPLKTEEQQPQQKQFSGPAPALSGSGSESVVGEEVDADSLTDEQLERILIKKGMLSR